MLKPLTIIATVLLSGWCMSCFSSVAMARPQDLLDATRAWQPIASDGVAVKVEREQDSSGRFSLRIDYDFTAGAGYGGATLELPIILPENYDLSFSVRGTGPANNLELKLVDPQKLNVWWINRRAFEWPREATRLTNRKRHLHFAWGPSGGEPLGQLGHIEIIIAAAEGGKGSVWISDFALTPLAPEKPYTGTPTLGASSNASPELQSLLTAAGGAWQPTAADAVPALTINFGQPRDLGGLVVHRPSGAGGDLSIETSDDGDTWTTLRTVQGATDLPSEVMLTDLQTRQVRLSFKPSKEPIQVSRIELLDTAVGASPNAFWKHRAARAPRGVFPQHLLGQQSFWTVMGQPGDDREALINEEGQIELSPRGVSIEPFVIRENKLLTWADGVHEQTLRDGWMPMPSVIRRHDGLELIIEGFASGTAGESVLHARYTLRNTSAARATGELILATRPLQVLPPWQDLNLTGGWSPLRSARVDGNSLVVNEAKDAKRIIASRGATLSVHAYDSGDPVEHLSRGNTPAGAQEVADAQKSASALMRWPFDLAAGASMTALVAVPFHGIKTPTDLPADAQEFEALQQRVAMDWHAAVNRVTFRLPPTARQFHDTLRATQAYILINHDGKGFQPGSRTYDRSWMRDGSMTSAAMLELGHDELVKQFVDWIAPFQFESGKVPCVVDRRGPDPVPEHDSHGQLIWLIANTYRYTHDSELVRRHFPRVKKAVEYIESLRAERMTDQFGASGPPRQEPGKPPVPAIAFRGLVPESISHEGYSAKPMHSYWDTFFVLRGLSDAAYLADVAGEPALAAKWRSLTDEFRQSLIDSIGHVQRAHNIDYLPGCVELGDFDSTSSTILLWPVDEATRFPRAWVDATFERAWREFVKRRDTTPATWDAYTPYELRHIGTYVRLGRKDRAWEALNYFFTHQRPEGWRHWAEVVWREPTTPRMIGDMPHTWCGSDFLNAVRAMFVYEDQHASKLIVLSGLPDAWLSDPQGVAFEGLRTEYGALSAVATPNGPGRLLVKLTGDAAPPGGIELCSPRSDAVVRALVNGEEAAVEENRVILKRLPATVELFYKQ